MLTFHVLVVLFAVLMLVRHGGRALLFAAPGLVRTGGDPGSPPATPAQARAGEELARLGFLRLGARRERGALRGLDVDSDAWASPAEGAYADVLGHAAPGGRGPQVYFLSPFADGAMVLTANHPRLSRSSERLQTGALPEAPIAATWAAHRAAVARFAAGHGPPAAAADLSARQEAARAWYRGPGRPELRRRFWVSFLDTLVAVLVAAVSLNALARGLILSRGGPP